jgi:hypothetical protein
MENNNQNNNIYKNIADSSGGKLNTEAIKQAAKSGNTDALIKNLSDSDKQKLNAILKDKDAMEKLLKSPQAAAIIKMLSKGKKNG